MKTKDGLSIKVEHRPEAENDFVRIIERPCDGRGEDYCRHVNLQPDEAVELATELLRYARIAREAALNHTSARASIKARAIDDIKMLRGKKPYNKPSNINYGDAYFAAAIVRRYSQYAGSGTIEGIWKWAKQ